MAIDKDEPELTTEQIKERLAANKEQQEAVIGDIRGQIESDFDTLSNKQIPFTEGRKIPSMQDLSNQAYSLGVQLKEAEFQAGVKDLLAQNSKETKIGRILLGPDLQRDMYQGEQVLAENAAQRKAAREAEEKESERKALEAKISPEGMTKFVETYSKFQEAHEKVAVDFTLGILREAREGVESSGDPRYDAANSMSKAYMATADIRKDDFKTIVDQRETAYREAFKTGLFNDKHVEKIENQLGASLKRIDTMLDGIDKRIDLLRERDRTDLPQYQELIKMRDNLGYEQKKEEQFLKELKGGIITVKKASEVSPQNTAEEKAPEKAAPAAQYITMNVDESQIKNAINQGQIGDTRGQNLDQTGSLSPAQIAVALPPISKDFQVG